MTIERWITASEAAKLLGEGVDSIRQKMRSGIIRSRDISAAAAQRRQWRTTSAWLAEYQSAATEIPAHTTPQPVQLLSGLTYKDYKRQYGKQQSTTYQGN